MFGRRTGASTLNVEEILSHDGEFHADTLRKLLEGARDNKFGIVTVIGDYQIGKSALLKKLTGSERFKVGNGTESETMGAQMSEAVILGDICKRFNIEEPDDSKQALFFIDTEGTGSEGMTVELERKIVGTLIPISSIVLVLLNPNSTRDSLEIFGWVPDLNKLFDPDFGPKIVFCVRTNGRMAGGEYYKGITREMFEEYQSNYRKIRKNLFEGIRDPRICPIPCIPRGRNPSIDEVSDYEFGMKLVMEEILKAFEDSPKLTKQDIDSIIEKFESTNRFARLIQMLNEERRGGIKEFMERKSADTIESILNKKKEQFNSMNTVNQIDTSIDGTIKEACDEYMARLTFLNADQALVDEGITKLSSSLKKEGFNRIAKIMINELTCRANDLLSAYRRLSEGSSIRYITEHKDADLRSFSEAVNNCIDGLERRWSKFSIPGKPYELYREVFSIDARVKSEIEAISKTN